MSPSIGAIILAAGLSSRMGRFKPLLPLGGATVLERVVDLYRQAGVPEVRVVLGHRAQELSPLLRHGGARAVLNPDYREGMFSSVRAGVAGLGLEVAAFFIHPVDIPLVSPGTIAALCQAWERGGRQVIYPCFQGRRGHPPLLCASLAGPIAAWPGEGGLKALLRQYQDQALEVPVADEFILRDMDHPADYERLAREWPRPRREPPAGGEG
ncbi:MAG: nucleotidyltransferase family protein [Pseudomonadota bacterium]